MKIPKYTKMLESTVILIYCLSVSIISFFHEPWFDEAQAWLIARDNNFFDMIWNVLRYEGHTPLWYIFLYIPSHLGIPYEIGLKSFNIIFMTLAVILIVKKSPFPLFIRLLVPFTYFFFYQYGVISRSYSLFTLILILIAKYFNTRNERPFRFVMLLALLGGVAAHGMLIAFGIALAWFVDIYRKYSLPLKMNTTFFYNLVNDIRFRALLLLGLINILYVIILWPRSDKFTPLQNDGIEVSKIFFRMFVAPLNSILVDQWPYTSGNWSVPLYFSAAAGIIFLVFLIIYALTKPTSLYILFPYLLTALFMSTVYFSGHHSGIYMLIILYSIWITLNCKETDVNTMWRYKTPSVLKSSVQNLKLMKPLLILSFYIIFITNIFWVITASYNDVRFPYSDSRDVAMFIKKNNLEKRKIFNCYSIFNEEPSYSTMNQPSLAYFPENIYYNLNFGNKKMSFVAHKEYSKSDIVNYINHAGKPEFIYDSKSSIKMYPELFDPKEYTAIAFFEGYYLWKYRTQDVVSKFYIRNDLIAEFPQLGEIITIETEYYYN